MNLMFPLDAARVISRDAMALYLLVLAWTDEFGVCRGVDAMAEMEGGFAGIGFENAMEELVQAGLVDEHYEDEAHDIGVLGTFVSERRDARVSFYEQMKHARLSPERWEAIRVLVFERDNYTCQYCLKIGGDLECDHVDAISEGGTNEIGNLVTACRSCNRSKRAKKIEEWRKETGSYVA